MEGCGQQVTERGTQASRVSALVESTSVTDFLTD